MGKLYATLFILLITIFLLHFWLVGQAVYGDGIYYWSYVRSVVIQGDINFIDEIRHEYNHQGNNTQEKISSSLPTSVESQLAYHLPIGPAVGWLPFFLFAQGVGVFLAFFGAPILLNGYSDLYQIIVGIGNVGYCVIGVWLVYKILRIYYPPNIAGSTVGTIFFSSNLFYYSSIDVLNSHPFSFFLSSMFVYLWLSTQKQKKWYHWIVLGGIVGLLALTRTQEIIFLLIPILTTVITVFTQKKIRFSFINTAQHYSLFFIGLAVMFLPQIALWQIYYHRLVSPYVYSQHAFTFLSPHIFGLLLNEKTGILYTSPIMLVGFVGFYFLLKKQFYVFLPLVCLVVLEFYLIASWLAWDQAASYGIRMLLTSIPILALGAAEVVEQLLKKYSGRFLGGIAVCLFVVNLLMILRFHFLIKDPTRSGNVITRVEAVKKMNRVFHTNFQWFEN